MWLETFRDARWRKSERLFKGSIPDLETLAISQSDTIKKSLKISFDDHGSNLCARRV